MSIYWYFYGRHAWNEKLAGGNDAVMLNVRTERKYVQFLLCQ